MIHMSSIGNLESIFRLASLGWKVYPVSSPDYNGDDPGKSPWCQHGFRDATASVGEILEWVKEKPGCNWGVFPCEGMLVLDADVKHGGLEALASLEAKHGKMPPTPCVQSGGGGRHYYFACPSDFTAKDKIGDCVGLGDNFGTGRGRPPPSIHAKTRKPYVWLVAAVANAPCPSSRVAPQAGQDWRKRRLGYSGLGRSLRRLRHVGGVAGRREERSDLLRHRNTHFARGESEEEVLEHAPALGESPRLR